MPIYEYVCATCRQEFEALVRGEEKPECPGCGATNLTKLISVPSCAQRDGSESSGLPHRVQSCAVRLLCEALADAACSSPRACRAAAVAAECRISPVAAASSRRTAAIID